MASDPYYHAPPDSPNYINSWATSIQEYIGDLQGRIESSMTLAETYIQQLSGNDLGLPDEVLPDPPDVSVDYGLVPPPDPDLEINIEEFEPPDLPDTSGLVAGLTAGHGSVPKFDRQTDLSLPDDGIEFTAVEVPSSPPDSITIPPAPDLVRITAPELDALQGIIIPEINLATIPPFTTELEAFGQAPLGADMLSGEYDAKLGWFGQQYADAQTSIQASEPGWSGLNAKIIGMLETGGGLPADIEEAIFQAARDRVSNASVEAIENAVDAWAARGFSMPPGMLTEQTNAVNTAFAAKVGETSRDVAIEATRLKQEALRFVMDLVWRRYQHSLEAQWRVWDTAFTVAKDLTAYQAQVFESARAVYNEKFRHWQSRLDAWRANLEKDLGLLREQLSAVDKSIADNDAKIRVFLGKWDGIGKEVEAYKGVAQTIEALASAKRAQFEAYAVEIQAARLNYEQQRTASVERYQALMQGNSIKANLLDAESRAYSGEVEAVRIGAAIDVQNAQARIAALNAAVEQLKVFVDTKAAQYNLLLKKLTSEAELRMANYSAVSEYNRGSAQIAVSTTEARSRLNVGIYDIQARQYDALRERLVKRAEMLKDAIKAAGQMESQLAAGAMSALHMGGSIQTDGRYSADYSYRDEHNWHHGQV